MTYSEIDAMPAGREMDAVVARVMGDEKRYSECPQYLPVFSTQHAAACQAWEHFKELWHVFYGSGLWHVERWDGDNDRWDSSSAPTMPLAICRAVLHHAAEMEEAK